MATYVRKKLSHSNDGKAISVGTNSGGSNIHTPRGNGLLDRVHLWAHNCTDYPVSMSLVIDASHSRTMNSSFLVPSQVGLMKICDGFLASEAQMISLILRGGSSYGSTIRVLIFGYVDEIT